MKSEEEPPFDISIDRSRRLLTVTLRGFWQRDGIALYWKQFDVAIKPLRGAGPILCLVDASDFAIQSAHILAYYERVSEGSRLDIDRIAIVTTSTLSKLQLAKLFPRRHLQQFCDRAAAATWLEGAYDPST